MKTVSTVFRAVAAKPLKRLAVEPPVSTGLKPGANERLRESELRLFSCQPFRRHHFFFTPPRKTFTASGSL
jgi:hypothetical protein